MFEPFLLRWDLIPDGDPVTTANARLLPVLRGGEPAMLKLALEQHERAGGMLMECWDGVGAAQVLAREDDGLLLERATGRASLSNMSRSGDDDEVTFPPAWDPRVMRELASLEGGKDAEETSHGGADHRDATAG